MIEDVAKAIDAFRRLSRKPAILLVILADAQGRIVTRGSILDVFDDLFRTTGDDGMLNTTLKHLRAALRGSDLTIQTVNGVGLRLIAPPGWVKPWAAPAPKTAATDGHWPGCWPGRLLGD